MADLDLTEWLTAKKLPQAVATALKDHGFDTLEVLTIATPEDFASLDLKRGHLVALRAAVAELQTSSPQASRLTRTSPTHLLDELLKTTPAGGSGGGRIDLEPTAFLCTKRGEKPLRIIDFINLQEVREDEEVELGGGLSIRLPRQTKPKLENVTPAQFIAANARIMATLIESGRLADTEVLDYLAYTAKVGEMATRYTWGSVLLYDDHYRHSQVAYGFRWGCDSQHLAVIALRERTQDSRIPNSRPGTTNHRTSTTRTHPPRLAAPSGKQVCQQWNRGNCTFSPNCKYEHVCSVCLQRSHPATSHTQAPQPTPTGSLGTRA
jgi:hypothetical protein